MGGGSGFGSELTNYLVDAYHYATDYNYLASITLEQCVLNYPHYGNKVLRVYYMAIVLVAELVLTFPTFVDLQFAATSSQNELHAYVVNCLTDYRFLIQHQDYHRTTSGQPVISIVKSSIRAIPMYMQFQP